MKISVVIPTYNSLATIGMTLDSVLAQTSPPDEILVMDDGSTDQTVNFLKSYGRRLTVLQQPNSGVGVARDVLIARSTGEMVAFLDSDDLWHPRFLEEQRKLYDRFPKAAGFFRAHENLYGLGVHAWNGTGENGQKAIELIPPIDFIMRVCVAPGPFVISFCSVPRRVLEEIGRQPPFKLRLGEDVYFGNLLPLYGPLVFAPTPLGAYRIREGSQSSSRLKMAGGEVDAFEQLEGIYEKSPDASLTKTFRQAFAVKRRQYAKLLLGVGKIGEARRQLAKSLSGNSGLVSNAKSLALLLISGLPNRLQPAWPAADRELRSPQRVSGGTAP